MQQHKQKSVVDTRGVTLVELLVTLVIFSAVTAVLLGSFLTLFSVREQVDIAQRANDSVRVILDGIDREIQSGSNIQVSEGGSAIKFTVSSREDVPPYQVQYRLRDGVVQKAIQAGKPGEPCSSLVSGELPEQCFLPVTDDTMTITTLAFGVIIAEEEQGQTSPLVTLGLSGTVQDSSGKTMQLSYSTSITPRNRINVGDTQAPLPGDGPFLQLTGLSPEAVGCSISSEADLSAPASLPGDINVNYEYYTDCEDMAMTFEGSDDAGIISLSLSGGSYSEKENVAGMPSTEVTFLSVPTADSEQVYTIVLENLYGVRVTQTIRIHGVLTTPIEETCGRWMEYVININRPGSCGVPNTPDFASQACGPDGTSKMWYFTNASGRCTSIQYVCECGTDTLDCKDIVEGGCKPGTGPECNEHGVIDRVSNSFNPCVPGETRCNARDEYHWKSEGYCP